MKAFSNSRFHILSRRPSISLTSPNYRSAVNFNFLPSPYLVMAYSPPSTALVHFIVAIICIVLRVKAIAFAGEIITQDPTPVSPAKAGDLRNLFGNESTRVTAIDDSRALNSSDELPTDTEIEALLDTESVSKQLAGARGASSLRDIDGTDVDSEDSRDFPTITDVDDENLRVTTSRISSACLSPGHLDSESYVHGGRANRTVETACFGEDLQSPSKPDPWRAYDIIAKSDVVESWELLRQVRYVVTVRLDAAGWSVL